MFILDFPVCVFFCTVQLTIRLMIALPSTQGVVKGSERSFQKLVKIDVTSQCRNHP
jgi:hypothetical protein